MNIHIATQGTSISPVVEGLKHFSVDKLILLHNSGSKRTAREVQTLATSLNTPCELEEIDMFDQVSIVEKIIEIHRRRGPEDKIFINMTGGTKLMSASATVAAYMIAANAYYIIEQTKDIALEDRIIKLPLPRVSVSEVKGLKYNILTILDERGTLEKITSLVRDEFETSAQTASYHLNELEKMGLVSLETKGRKKIARITAEGRIILRLLM